MEHAPQAITSLWEVTVSGSFTDMSSRAAKVALWAKAPGVKAVLALDRGAFYSLGPDQQGALINTVTGSGGYIRLFRDLKSTALRDVDFIKQAITAP